MTISFTASGKDGRHFLRYMATQTLTGRCVFALLLLMPAALPVWILHAVASEHPAHPLPTSLLWLIIAFDYFLLLLAVSLGFAVASVIRRDVTVTFNAESCSWESYGMLQTLVWRKFTTVTEDADYIFLLGWRLSYYIPKSAFPSRAAAEAFYEKMHQSWQAAK
jgi:hypothetical protein